MNIKSSKSDLLSSESVKRSSFQKPTTESETQEQFLIGTS